MEIVDYTKKDGKSTPNMHNNALFPKNILCVIAGSSGSGKTNLMMNLLRNENTLHYSDVYIYTTTMYQTAYENLKNYFNTLEQKIKVNYGINHKICHFFDTDEEIKNPSELDAKTHHVMIFDDVMFEDQKTIKDYFCKGRHNNVNVFYLCQSLHKISKHCIRENANIFILFHQDDKALKYFHETHISGDMDFKEFKSFCDKTWSKKYGFVVINILDEPYCGRYVSNYNCIYVPNKYKLIQINTN